MKKFAKAFLGMFLALAFTVSAIAAPAIDYVVKDTVNGKEYIFLFGSYDDEEVPSEAGITLNGKDYKLSLPSMIELPKSKRFGMAISDESNLLGDSFTAVPYTRDEYGIKTEGEQSVIAKEDITLPHDYNTKDASGVVSAFYANDWGNLQAGTNGLAFIETDSYANLGFTMDPIGVALLKIDLTKLTDYDLNRKFILNVKGYGISGTLDHMTFGSYMVDSDWTEVSAVAGTTPGLFYKTYAYNKKPMATTSITKDSLDFSIDISAAVFHALKAGKTEAVVALAPDNRECKKLSEENGTRYDTMFNFYVSGDKAPTITYYTEDKSGYNGELASIKVGDNYLPGLKDGKTEFNVYLPYKTEELPPVSVTAEPDTAIVSVTQATLENKKATVSVTPKYGGEAKEYTVNYIISAERAGETYTLDYQSPVFADVYSIEPLTDVTAPVASNIKRETSAISVYEDNNKVPNTFKDSMAFLKFDLTELKNIDKGSPVKLKLHGGLVSDKETDRAQLEFYHVDSDLWTALNNSENLIPGVQAATDIDSVVSKGNLVLAKTLDKSAKYWAAYAEVGDIEFDLSAYIAYCLDNNITTPTLALRINPLDAQTYQHRFYFWLSGSSLTYSDKDMSGYEANLGTITIDGKSIYQFDEETTSYNYYIPYGTENYPVVSATAETGNVTVTQATKENPKATVTLSPEYAAGESLKYVINFIEGTEAAAEETTIACSDSGIISDAYSLNPNYTSTKTNEENKSHVRHAVNSDHSTGYNPYSNAINLLTCVAYVKFDLTKLADINRGQPVYFDMYGSLGSNVDTFESADVELYSVDNSVWTALSDEDLSVGAAAALDVNSVVNEKNFITKVSVERTTDLWGSAGAAAHRADITQFVNYCLENNITEPTIAVRVKPLDLPATYLRFRLFTNSTSQSKVIYTKNAVSE